MKVTGPLHSERASGTFADILTFSNRKSGQQCRFQRKQKDANSVDQNVQRAKFQLAICACNFMMYGEAVFGVAIYGNSLGLYTSEADRKHMTEQNECASQYLNN